MKKLSKIVGSIVSVVLISFTVIGCTTPEERVKPQAQVQQPVQAATESKTDTVKIVAMKFVPAELTVPAGTTIVFENNDMVTHDVTEETNHEWSSNLMPPLKVWSMVADKSANYYCSIHAVMKGKIIVTR